MTDYRGAPPQGTPPAAGPAPVALGFVDVSGASGIAFRHGGPGGEAGPAPPAAGAALARWGSGIGVGGLDGDGLPDLVFANGSVDGKSRPAVYPHHGSWTFPYLSPAPAL